MSEPELIELDGASLKVWREAPALEDRRTAAVGAFACPDADAGARLLAEAARRLAAEGFQAVVGPMDGDTWGRHRLIVESDGRPAFLTEPQNPDWHPAAFERAGWDVVARYASSEGPLAAPEARTQDDALILRPFDPGRAEAELERIHALSLKAFARNFLYRPLPLERFLAGYRPVLPLLDPELVVLAETAQGDLRGFLFALPDAADASPERAAILKTYASLDPGLGSRLARRFYERAAAQGYSRTIHAFMHDDNLSARHSANLGARVFRRYALWARDL